MIQWEEVALEDATHVEINGCVIEMKERDGIVERSVDFGWIDILVGENKWVQIPKEGFFVLGIRCLRKKKREPIKFEREFVKFDGRWDRMPEFAGSAYKNCKTVRFRCVEILEEEE
jgi:hypothetical protein